MEELNPILASSTARPTLLSTSWGITQGYKELLDTALVELQHNISPRESKHNSGYEKSLESSGDNVIE